MLEPVEPVRLLPLGYTQVFSRLGPFYEAGSCNPPVTFHC